jgi:pseudomonalisin
MTAMFSASPRTSAMLLLLTLAGIFTPVTARAERIPQTMDNANLWRLRGSVPPHARAEFDRGAVDGSLRIEGMKLVFQLTPEQQSSLDTLLRQQLDPASTNYHKWLTPEQYAERFGVSSSDISRAAGWLRQQRFTAIIPARSRTWIGFNGSAAQVESAFHTPILSTW